MIILVSIEIIKIKIVIFIHSYTSLKANVILLLKIKMHIFNNFGKYKHMKLLSSTFYIVLLILRQIQKSHRFNPKAVIKTHGH